MRKPRFRIAIAVIILMFLIIAAYVIGAYKMIAPEENVICNGVYVDQIDLSGMTKEQATDAVAGQLDIMAKRTIEVDVNGKKATTTLEELNYACESGNLIDEAMKVGKQGNLFTKYAEIKRVAKEHQVYSLSYSYSEEKLAEFVSKKCAKYCTKAKNAKIKMQGGQLVYTDSKDGVSIDTEQTLELLKTAIKEQETEEVIHVTAVVTVAKPKVTKEIAERCKDKLGSYSTSFNPGNVSRSKNVANAARLINGTVIYPGETFSVHDTISPMTEENGYYAAPSYNNGQVVDSIGGGVCQVSTTLYNAVLRAELEVVTRSPHSMMVSYVPPSQDAAIAGDYKDFKFKNNTKVPIYVQGGTYGGTIYFNVYGEETRSSDRTIEFKSEVIEKMEPGPDKVTLDKTKPEGFMQVTQEAHTGYKAELWKIVTENGKTKKTKVNSSLYKAEPRYVTKGAAKATSKPSEKPQETQAPAESKATKAPKSTKAPAATAAPQATQAPAADPAESDAQ